MVTKYSSRYLLIIAYLLLTLPLAYELNLGGDEGYTLESTSGNFATTFERAVGFEGQAPLYFLFLNIWRNLNGSIFFARIFSLLAILGAILLFINLLEVYLKNENIIWYALLFAFNPLTIWAALEIRLYALLVFLSTLVLFIFAKRVDPNSKPYIRMAFITSSIIGIYTQYYFFILPATLITIFILNNGIKKSKTFLVDFVIILLFCFPIPILVTNQLIRFPKREIDLLGFLRGVKKLLQYEEQIFLPIGKITSSTLGRYLIRGAFFSIIISVIYDYRKNKIKIFNSYNIFPFYIIISGLIFAISTSVLIRLELLNIRHLIYLLPAWILLLCIIISASNNKYKKYIFIIISFVVYCFALFNDYHSLAKNGDYKRVSDYIMKHEDKGQPIFIFPNTECIIFKYYYKGINSVFSIPREASTTEYDIYKRRINSKSELEKLFDERMRGQNTLWMVILPVDQYMDVDYNIKLLEEYMAVKFDVLSTKIFYKETRVHLLSGKK
jgi:4-amino-4-deoxy-L-arabinose transferase-like glycosyltransferase